MLYYVDNSTVRLVLQAFDLETLFHAGKRKKAFVRRSSSRYFRIADKFLKIRLDGRKFRRRNAIEKSDAY